MRVVQWTMTIPAELQQDFVEYFHSTLSPTWAKFGSVDHKILRSKEETGKIIEVLFFPADYDVADFFGQVKSDKEALEISKSYETRFKATNIKREILEQL